MMHKPYSYNLFFDFIESYLPSGFQDINADDPVMQKLEKVMEENDQCFSVADLGKIQFVFTSKRSYEMMGVRPEELHPGHFLDAVHPDDLGRFGLARGLLFRLENEISILKKGSRLLSASFKFKNSKSSFSNLLIQCYLFYTPIPYPVVFDIQVYTNIDSFLMKNDIFHHYSGDEISQFRFPDKELLRTGTNLSSRELEIVRQVKNGLSSKEIAEKLFLSVYTVNTHRSNILLKSGTAHISELIFKLKDQGLI